MTGQPKNIVMNFNDLHEKYEYITQTSVQTLSWPGGYKDALQERLALGGRRVRR